MPVDSPAAMHRGSRHGQGGFLWSSLWVGFRIEVLMRWKGEGKFAGEAPNYIN